MDYKSPIPLFKKPVSDGGRHPMVEALRVDPFVPISCTLGGGEPRTKIITGPNMGGKR